MDFKLVYLELNVLLLEAEHLALRCLDLLLNQVDAGDHLCHRVLHLEGGKEPVHIESVQGSFVN